jgi:hypothetical protein
MDPVVILNATHHQTMVVCPDDSQNCQPLKIGNHRVVRDSSVWSLPFGGMEYKTSKLLTCSLIISRERA